MNSRKPKYIRKIIDHNNSFGFITHGFFFLNKLAVRTEEYAMHSNVFREYPVQIFYSRNLTCYIMHLLL